MQPDNKESPTTTNMTNDLPAVSNTHGSYDLLAEAPKIARLYQQTNNSIVAKLIWSLCVSSGMALYNYRKEAKIGDLADGLSSASVSLVCNILVSYEFCLKSPFLAAAVLSEIRKKPKLAIVILAALIASGALTAQLVYQQPAAWAIAIGSSAFLNYSATRLSGLIDNNHYSIRNTIKGSVGLVIFSPLMVVWMGDTASLFSSPSIPKMITNSSLSKGAYIAGSASALFGIIGSFITTLFYCQAISSVPKKIQLLYTAWTNLLTNNLGLSDRRSKLLGGPLAMLTTGLLGYVGYYSMAGFYVAVLGAFKCTPVAGELCWLTQAINLSSLWIDVLATFQQITTGLINTSALIPAFTKFIKCATFDREEDERTTTPSESSRSSGSYCCFFRPVQTTDRNESSPLLADNHVPDNMLLN